MRPRRSSARPIDSLGLENQAPCTWGWPDRMLRCEMKRASRLGKRSSVAFWRPLQQLCRIVALLVVWQLAGIGHLAEDVRLLCGAAACHESDCENEPDRCPPGCPNCHCPARLNVVVPTAANVVILNETNEFQVAVFKTQEERPDSPFLASLYRPPRQV